MERVSIRLVRSPGADGRDVSKEEAETAELCRKGMGLVPDAQALSSLGIRDGDWVVIEVCADGRCRRCIQLTRQETMSIARLISYWE